MDLRIGDEKRDLEASVIASEAMSQWKEHKEQITPVLIAV